MSYGSSAFIDAWKMIHFMSGEKYASPARPKLCVSCTASVSESASRRRAVKSATDNADELITKYTRDMNSARQAGITQEISEIVGGANALAAAGGQD